MSDLEKNRKELLSLIIKNEMNPGFNLYDYYENPIEDLRYLIRFGYLNQNVLIKTMTGDVISLGGPHCITDAGRHWVS